ncbi:hypothetical protein ACFVHS_25035 [Streptomyces sp. NPDC057746]|uniref:hypothetical protein n=1 Tax=Streptomyces sp. NPDC057746 TaxID=3346237 RepID=UPI003691E5EB
MTARPYCRCVVVCNYDYAEAAAKLKCKRRFLEDRISTLPHQKLGESVAFCDCELALIQAMFTKTPASMEASRTPPAPQSADSTPAVPALAAIRPTGGRRRTPAGV